jgi:hypothetical protein
MEFLKNMYPKRSSMLGQIIVTAMGIIALVIGLWTIKEMQQQKQSKCKK